MTTLVDSSVLLDIIAPSEWRSWSEAALIDAFDAGDVAINQVVYAEVAVGYASQQRLERALGGIGLVRLNFPFTAAWRVATAFAEYRRSGGPRRTALPDFFIAAHAAAADLTLLTRDPARVRTYFPEVRLVAPEGS